MHCCSLAILRRDACGQLIGDGSYLLGKPLRYTTASEENSEIVSAAARDEFGSTVRRYAGRWGLIKLVFGGLRVGGGSVVLCGGVRPLGGVGGRRALRKSCGSRREWLLPLGGRHCVRASTCAARSRR